MKACMSITARLTGRTPNMPSPINAPQTRVVEMPHGFYSDFSTDGLKWISLGQHGSLQNAVERCEDFMHIASTTPYVGEVVWRSAK